MMADCCDRIQARFTREGGVVKGNTLIDSRRKIVLISGYDVSRPDPAVRLPRHGEEWICDVLSETKREDPFHGALRVRLVEPLKLVIPTLCGGRLIVPSETLQRLRAQPEVVSLLDKVVARVVLPKNGEQLAVEINMNKSIGRSRIVQAPEIEVDQPVLFAQRIGRRRPSRVIMGRQAERTTIVSLRAEAASGVASYRLRTAALGKLTPREPWSALRDESELRYESLPFWQTHAYCYDSRTMLGEAFTSTWEEIMSRSDPMSQRPTLREPRYEITQLGMHL